MTGELGTLANIVSNNEGKILPEWLDLLKTSGILQSGRLKEGELATHCRSFLHALRDGLAGGNSHAGHESYAETREILADFSRSRAVQGFSPSETATFVFSLKQPLFNVVNREKGLAPAVIVQMIWAITALLDQFGLYTVEVYQKSRESIISRQQREISELSTPVVKLWKGILALPVIGTLDSERTQIVMENLLQAIVTEGAEIAIIDITGVPTVDTLTAQHLLKTTAAARLMGADCIISGIRPQIAQTMVHLGVELNVISKATLADAFQVALRRTGRAITKLKSAAPDNGKSLDEDRVG